MRFGFASSSSSYSSSSNPIAALNLMYSSSALQAGLFIGALLPSIMGLREGGRLGTRRLNLLKLA